MCKRNLKYFPYLLIYPIIKHIFVNLRSYTTIQQSSLMLMSIQSHGNSKFERSSSVTCSVFTLPSFSLLWIFFLNLIEKKSAFITQNCSKWVKRTCVLRYWVICSLSKNWIKLGVLLFVSQNNLNDGYSYAFSSYNY